MMSPMETVFALIAENIFYAPLIIFGLLILAGFFIPVPEDGMLFISGLLASENPHYTVQLFLGVYAGAYFSDLIAYSMGRLLGSKLYQIRFLSRLISKEKIEKMSRYFESHGMKTLIVGRFIPFGFRNAMFLSAGISRMNFYRFAFADWVACTISTSTFFALYYTIGSPVIAWVKKGNIIIFAVFVVVITAAYAINRRRK